MAEAAYRLGDLIDDYCPRCRLLLNHAVASLVENKVVKVICQTCYSEHPYLHGKGGKKKRPSRRATLFDQVLSKVSPSAAPVAESAQDSPDDPKKKRPSAEARYISRHKSKPRRKG